MEGFDLTTISNCYIGSTPVSAIYYSSVKIWPTHDYSLDYLTFESLDNNNYFTFSTDKGYTPLTIYYSIDNGDTWQTLTDGQSTATIDAGEKIIWKYTGDRTWHSNFGSNGQFNVSGNIMSMCNGDNFTGQTTISTNDTFNGLFSNCSGLVDASNLILPATTLAQQCYYYMFSGCTSLTTTPELPATTLANYCYTGMFDGCTSLTIAPELPATTLAQGCYQYMFQFCTSLATAPELLATTLATVCYQCMFQGCTNLNYIKCLATDISAFACVDEWVNSVAQTGTFVKDSTMNDWTTGSDGIPTGWTVESTIQPCFAVVDNIAQYTDTSFVDVYNNSDGLWYKLNNLNQYEVYGEYEKTNNLSSVTYYTNKLVALTTDNHEYKWNGSTWIDCGLISNLVTQLPSNNIFNYNAKNYNSTTKVITNNSNDANMPDVTLSSAPTVSSNYITISNQYALVSGIQSTLERSNANPEITIISKARTTSGCNIFANRTMTSGYNYMYRQYNNKLTLHGSSEQGSISISNNNVPTTLSVKIGSNRTIEYHNWTDDTTSTTTNFNYGAVNIGDAVLFKGNSDSNIEQWSGDFYWISLYTKTLTDSEIEQVIDFNEDNAGAIGYPVEYDTKVAPPNYVHYSTLEELEMMECPWIGMIAYVGTDIYIYTDNGWELKQQTYDEMYLTFEAIEDSQFKFTRNSLYYSLDNGTSWTLINNNTYTPTVTAGNTILWKQTGLTSGIDLGLVGSFSSTGNFNVYGNMLSILWGDAFKTYNTLNNNGDFTCLFYNCTTLISAENLIFGIDTITKTYAYQRLFAGCTNLIKAPIELPATTVAGQSYEEMFNGCIKLTDGPIVKATSLNTYCCYKMFYNCTSLKSMTFYCTSKDSGSTTGGFSTNVASSGTFYAKNPSIWSTGDNGIPTGWTVETI